MKEYGIVIIRSDNTVWLCESDSKTLDCNLLRDLVGGGFEIVKPMMIEKLRSDIRIVVNECGHMIGLPVNRLATALYGNPCSVIVGDVVVVTSINNDPFSDPDIFQLELQDANNIYDFMYEFMQVVKNVNIQGG